MRRGKTPIRGQTGSFAVMWSQRQSGDEGSARGRLWLLDIDDVDLGQRVEVQADLRAGEQVLVKKLDLYLSTN